MFVFARKKNKSQQDQHIANRFEKEIFTGFVCIYIIHRSVNYWRKGGKNRCSVCSISFMENGRQVEGKDGKDKINDLDVSIRRNGFRVNEVETNKQNLRDET